jgi:hypothetical protein
LCVAGGGQRREGKWRIRTEDNNDEEETATEREVVRSDKNMVRKYENYRTNKRFGR